MDGTSGAELLTVLISVSLAVVLILISVLLFNLLIILRIIRTIAERIQRGTSLFEGNLRDARHNDEQQDKIVEDAGLLQKVLIVISAIGATFFARGRPHKRKKHSG